MTSECRNASEIGLLMIDSEAGGKGGKDAKAKGCWEGIPHFLRDELTFLIQNWIGVCLKMIM